MDTLRCGRCNTSHESSDNFCRRCGQGLNVRLPALTHPAAVARRSRALPRSLVGSVAVLAVGTGLEWAARRVMGSAAKAAGRALVSRGDASPAPRETQSLPSPTETTIEELIYLRKVSVRR